MGGGVVFPRVSSGNEGPWIPCFRRVGAVSLETRVSGVVFPSVSAVFPLETRA
jgi:hypothetical protein